MPKPIRYINPRDPYSILPKDMLFDKDDLELVENSAKAQTLEQVLFGFGIDEMEQLNADDQKYVDYAYKRGAKKFSGEAVDALFSHMKNPKGEGVKACMAYLINFTPGWKEDELKTGDNRKTFKVELTKCD